MRDDVLTDYFNKKLTEATQLTAPKFLHFIIKNLEIDRDIKLSFIEQLLRKFPEADKSLYSHTLSNSKTIMLNALGCSFLYKQYALAKYFKLSCHTEIESADLKEYLNVILDNGDSAALELLYEWIPFGLNLELAPFTNIFINQNKWNLLTVYVRHYPGIGLNQNYSQVPLFHWLASHAPKDFVEWLFASRMTEIDVQATASVGDFKGLSVQWVLAMRGIFNALESVYHKTKSLLLNACPATGTYQNISLFYALCYHKAFTHSWIRDYINQFQGGVDQIDLSLHPQTEEQTSRFPLDLSEVGHTTTDRLLAIKSSDSELLAHEILTTAKYKAITISELQNTMASDPGLTEQSIKFLLSCHFIYTFKSSIASHENATDQAVAFSFDAQYRNFLANVRKKFPTDPANSHHRPEVARYLDCLQLSINKISWFSIAEVTINLPREILFKILCFYLGGELETTLTLVNSMLPYLLPITKEAHGNRHLTILEDRKMLAQMVKPIFDAWKKQNLSAFLNGSTAGNVATSSGLKLLPRKFFNPLKQHFFQRSVNENQETTLKNFYQTLCRTLLNYIRTSQRMPTPTELDLLRVYIEILPAITEECVSGALDMAIAERDVLGRLAMATTNRYFANHTFNESEYMMAVRKKIYYANIFSVLRVVFAEHGYQKSALLQSDALGNAVDIKNESSKNWYWNVLQTRLVRKLAGINEPDLDALYAAAMDAIQPKDKRQYENNGVEAEKNILRK